MTVKGFHYHYYSANNFADYIIPLRAKTVRIEVYWSRIEPQDNVIDWNAFAEYDNQVKAALSQGAVPIILFGYIVPDWAKAWNHETAPPADPVKFGEFARFLAKRWQHVRGFEVWNEPNQARFWGGRNPDSLHYTKLLNAAFNQIKRVSDARVILGGVAPYQPDPYNDYQFIKQVLKNGGKCDAVGIHPYFDPASCIKRVRNVTTKPLVATEFGWTTCTTSPYCVSEAEQADHIKNELEVMDGKVTDAIVYTLRDPWDTDDSEGRFGLLRRDFTKKPAFFSVKYWKPS